MRKILIATPVRGNLPPRYVETLMLLGASMPPDTQLGFSFVDGAPVNLARNQLVAYAVAEGFDEMIFIDADLLPTLPQYLRLLSHTELDFVVGLYPRRKFITQFHVHAIEGELPDANGMQRVRRASIGFSKIKVAAIRKIMADHPHLAATFNETGEPPKKVFNLFSFEIRGRNTAAGKLEQIIEFIDSQWTYCADPMESLRHIEVMIKDSSFKDYSDNALFGEDFGFCELAFESGISIHVDTGLLVQHSGEVTLPVSTADIEAELKQGFRAVPAEQPPAID